MRKFIISTAAVLALAVPVVHAAPVEVLVKDNFFKPTKITIKKDRKVVWRWKGSNPHNVAIMKAGSNRVVRKSAIKTSGTYSHTFRRTGTWRAVCQLHPGMTMKVVVRNP